MLAFFKDYAQEPEHIPSNAKAAQRFVQKSQAHVRLVEMVYCKNCNKFVQDVKRVSFKDDEVLYDQILKEKCLVCEKLLYRPGRDHKTEPIEYGVFPSILDQFSVLLSNPQFCNELKYPEQFAKARPDLQGQHFYNSGSWHARDPSAQETAAQAARNAGINEKDIIDMPLLIYFDPVNYGSGGVGPGTLKTSQLFLVNLSLRPEIAYHRANLITAFVSTGYHINGDTMDDIIGHVARKDLENLSSGVTFFSDASMGRPSIGLIHVRARVISITADMPAMGTMLNGYGIGSHHPCPGCGWCFFFVY
jgi:hypothetical protein